MGSRAGGMGLGVMVIAAGGEARAGEWTHAVVADGVVLHVDTEQAPVRVGGELRFEHTWARLLAAYAGLRGVGPAGGPRQVPLEVFVGGGVSQAFGAWRPAVGPELGLTGLMEPGDVRGGGFFASSRTGRDGHFAAIDDAGPLYLALTCAPGRFVFGDWVALGIEVAPLRFALPRAIEAHADAGAATRSRGV